MRQADTSEDDTPTALTASGQHRSGRLARVALAVGTLALLVSAGCASDSGNGEQAGDRLAASADDDAPAPAPAPADPADTTASDSTEDADASTRIGSEIIDFEPAELPSDVTVVTAPPFDDESPPVTTGAWERIDPSPELPGMRPRPIEEIQTEPADERLLLVRFQAIACDGFRIVVEETPDSVTVTLEGATTLGPNEGQCAPDTFASELAALLTEPIGNRTIVANQP